MSYLIEKRLVKRQQHDPPFVEPALDKPGCGYPSQVDVLLAAAGSTLVAYRLSEIVLNLLDLWSSGESTRPEDLDD
jgi:hypothetical protein